MALSPTQFSPSDPHPHLYSTLQALLTLMDSAMVSWYRTKTANIRSAVMDWTLRAGTS